MSMFDIETQKQLSGILDGMQAHVKIILFKGVSKKSDEATTFVTEFCKFSPKLILEIHDFDIENNKAKEWEVFDAPAIFVTNKDESLRGVGFYGTPGGYEINSFITAILEVSGNKAPLSDDYKAIINKVSSPVYIYAYISLTCPQCPQAVMNIHRIAIENKNIRAYMIEGPAFKKYAEKFGVQAFPTIILGKKEKELIGENTKDMAQVVALFKS